MPAFVRAAVLFAVAISPVLGAAPVITTTSPLPAATIGVAYSDAFTASGGMTPYSWSAGELPAWLSFSSSGVLAGTPPQGTPSPVSFTVQLVDGQNSAVSGIFQLPIVTPAALSFVTTSPLPPATVGTVYSTVFSVNGGVGPYTFTATGLPSWLNLSAAGTLSGTPPSPGPATFAVTVTDSASNHLTANFTLPVNAVLTINTGSPLPPATANAAYSQTLAASGGTGIYTWSGSGLPTWLTLSNTGVLSGMPPAATSAIFTVTVTDSASATMSKMLTLPVNAALVIGTVSPLPAATLNSPYTATFTASGGSGEYTWSASGLPAGFSISNNGVLTGTPSSTSALAFTVRVTDSLSNISSKPFTLPVNGVLTINNSSPLTAAVAGIAYSANFTASGGNGGYSWSATGLPPWLTLTAAGYLSGTPPSAGAVTFTVMVSDSTDQTVSGSFTLPVDQALAITTLSPLPTGIVGVSYSLQLRAPGGSGTYTFTSSALPNWLTLSSSGLLTGTPPTAGSFVFSVIVRDADGQMIAASFTLPVSLPLVISTTSPLPPATVGAPYTLQFMAAGGASPYIWSAGNLSAGLTLSTTGQLSGTPPAAGSVTFPVTVMDSLGRSVTGAFTFQAIANLTITTASPLPPATVSSPYSLQFAAAGGSGTYTWTATGLPSGLTLSSSGLLSGTTTAAGSFTIAVTVTDSLARTATGNFTLQVTSGITITNISPLAPATVGVLYTFSFGAVGGVAPYTFSSLQLPTWLTLSPAGILSGTPPSSGPVTFTVAAADSAQNRTTSVFTLPVNAILTISNASPLPPATMGVLYSLQFAASGGSGVYTWRATNLPAWLSLSSSGLLSGTPPSSGSVTFSATVSDSSTQTATGSFVLAVNSAVTITNATSLISATAGVPYSLQFTASGGTGNYIWSGTGLPSGFTLSANGLLSGTPQKAGTFTFSIRVSDDKNNLANGTFTLPVSSALTITTTSPLVSAVAGTVYSLQLLASGGSGSYSWSATGLPHSLTLTSTGFLTGVPTTGTYTFTVAVTDTQGRQAMATFTLSAVTAVSITTPSLLPPGNLGSSFTLQLTAAGGSGSYNWSAANLPAGFFLTPGGLLYGSPSLTGNLSFAVTVTDGVTSAIQTFVLPVTGATRSPLTITTGSPLTPGTVGLVYSQQFGAAGGSGSYQWSAAGLPPSLSLSSNGVLSGTPVSAGVLAFSVTVLDKQTNLSVTQSFALTVSTALTITTMSPLPSALVGQTYSLSLSAAGGLPPYRWAANSFAPGLSLSASGAITGTPTVPGTFTLNATVTDATGRIATGAFTLQVTATLTISTATLLPAGVLNTPYSATFTAIGGTGTYTWTGSGLPPGLSLSATGVLSGTPAMAGSFTVNATVTDSAAAIASKQFTLLIASGAPLSIVSAALAPCAAGGTCTSSIVPSGGTPPYTFTLVGTPAGGTVTVSAGGVVSGTGLAPGTITLTVQLTDGMQNTVTKTVTLQVVAPVLLTVPASAAATAGTNFSLTPTATQGVMPYVWSIVAGSLPPGIVLSTTTGVLSGIPTATGTFTFTLQVADATGSTARTEITLVISAPALVIQTSGLLPAGVAGSAYMQSLQAINGQGAVVWSPLSGSLPSGISLSLRGVLSGIPAQTGDFSFTIQAMDTSGATAQQAYQLHISAPTQIPAIAATLSATVAAGDQPVIIITLANPYPLPIVVTATLQISPSPGDVTDLLFSNGSRIIQFTIPANTTQTTLPFQAGTIAGTIQISFQLQAAGTDVTPNPAPVAITQIAASAPVIRSVTVAPATGGFQLTVTGTSTPRDMKNAAFHFSAANGANLQMADGSLDVGSFFAQWYKDAASLPTGSQFSMIVPISVSGNVSSIASVSVTLTNSVGTSNSVTVNLP